VTAELVRYVHLEIMIPVAEQLNWQSERGSEMWRALSARENTIQECR